MADDTRKENPQGAPAADLQDAEDAEIEAAIDPEASEAVGEGADRNLSQAEPKADVDAMALDGTNDQRPDPLAVDTVGTGEELEGKIPAKKDATLREFLGKMDDYAPIIPDAVVNHYLTLAGLPPPPQTHPHLARLLGLVAQKFVADIAADAYQYARIRTSHTTSNTANAMMAGAAGLPPQAPGANTTASGGAGKDGDKGGKSNIALGVARPGYGGGGQGSAQGRTVLTMEDLGMAAGEYGINVKRGEFYR